jgi:uncharacterized membrane protein
MLRIKRGMLGVLLFGVPIGLLFLGLTVGINATSLVWFFGTLVVVAGIFLVTLRIVMPGNGRDSGVGATVRR